MKLYLKIFKIGLSNHLEYRVNFLSSLLFSLVPFGVNTLLWVAVAYQNDQMLLGIEGIVSYYFITLIVSNITSTVSVLKISDDIRLGDLNKYLLKPYNYALYQLMIDMPQRIVFITINAVPLAIIYILLRKYIILQLSWAKIFLFIMFLFLSYLINFLIDFFISLYSFYFSKVSSFYTSISVLRNIASGTIFPLIMLPSGLFSALSVLPFMYTSYVPTMLLIDNVSLNVAFRNLLISLVWVLMLTFACMLLWKRGLRKYSAYGG